VAFLQSNTITASDFCIYFVCTYNQIFERARFSNVPWKLFQLSFDKRLLGLVVGRAIRFENAGGLSERGEHN
jgi:hypothetical protein